MNSKLVRSLLLGAGLVMVLSAVAEAAGPYQFFSVTPCRIVDTRRPNGVTGGPSLGNQVVRNFPIAGQCGVPATAKAAVLNVTIASPTNAGYLILYPYNTTQPLVSTIKLRQFGFGDCIDTEESIIQHLQAMQALGYLPR